jgi:hypothetical protein
VSGTITILSPVPEPAAAGSEAVAARRLPERVRVGLLSNGKPNTSHLLDGILDAFGADRRYLVSLRTAKPSSSHPAEQAVLNRLAAAADLVVGATAD